MPMLALVLAVYLALSAAFQWATPPLEASDEAAHVGYVLALQREHRLPIPARPGLAMQEALQPPLYYALAATLIAPLDTSAAAECFRRRPGSPIGRADLPGPRQMFLPPPPIASDRTLLAVRVVRLLSVALGVLTVVSTHATARALVPAEPRRAAFAAAVVAFNPMFLFVTAAVNNDALVIAAAAGLVFAMSRPGYDPARARTAAATGAWIGLATLGKLSALVLLPPALYRIAAAPDDRRRRARAATTLAAAFGAVAGWWFLRLRALAADPIVDAAHLAANLRRELQPLALLREWDGFLKSFWGVFGAFNVIFPDGVYAAFFALTALGLGSILVTLVRGPARRDPRVRGLAILTLTNLAAVAVWTSRLLGSQGRLMFPSLAAIAVLAAISLDGWSPPLRRLALFGVPAALVLAALWAAVRLIPAAYPPL